MAEFASTIQRPIWATPLFIAISTVLGLLIYGCTAGACVCYAGESSLEEKVTERTEEFRQEKQKPTTCCSISRHAPPTNSRNTVARTQHYESCSCSRLQRVYLADRDHGKRCAGGIVDRFFQAFDDAAIRYGLEKIKTIGEVHVRRRHPQPHRSARRPVGGLEMLRITDASTPNSPQKGWPPGPFGLASIPDLPLQVWWARISLPTTRGAIRSPLPRGWNPAVQLARTFHGYL